MITPLIYISFILASLIVVFNVSIYYALNKIFRFQTITKHELNISIVVAAKNESKNIAKLIESLRNQNYSKDNYEVIIVDDNSTDDTHQLANHLCKDFDNFHSIAAEDKSFVGKRGALDIGIKAATFPFVLITDADCEPEKEWINSFANKFSEKHDFVFGIAPFRSNNNFTNLVARFENLRASIITFAFARLGFPYSASARSFGFSKEAFSKIKGYENTTATLSGDDDLLLQEAIKNKLNVGIVTNSGAFVFSETKNVYSEYVKQKARHTSTSIHYSTSSKFLLAFWHLTNLLAVLSVVITPLNTIFLFPIFIKFVLDLFILNNFQNNLGYKINPLLFIGLQLQYEINLVFFFLKGLNFKNRWD